MKDKTRKYLAFGIFLLIGIYVLTYTTILPTTYASTGWIGTLSTLIKSIGIALFGWAVVNPSTGPLGLSNWVWVVIAVVALLLIMRK